MLYIYIYFAISSQIYNRSEIQYIGQCRNSRWKREVNAAETNAIAWAAWKMETRCGCFLALYATRYVGTHAGRSVVHKQGRNQPGRPSLSEQRAKGPQAREAAICWSCTTEDQVERSSVRSRSLEAWPTTSFPSPRFIASLVAICTHRE